MKGLVAFSFALRKNEPNPCNVRLAQATEVIVKKEGNDVIVVAQWEIARALKSVSSPYVIEKHRTEGEYLGSEEIWLQAVEVFKKHGVTEVIVVANPFLHLTKCRMLVKKSGFIPLKRKVGWIGFDRASLQWYARGPLRALLYAILQQFTGWHGR